MDSSKSDRVTQKAMSCYSLAECNVAEQEIIQWLHDNPEDWEFYELLKMVATLRAAAEAEQTVRRKIAA